MDLDRLFDQFVKGKQATPDQSGGVWPAGDRGNFRNFCSGAHLNFLCHKTNPFCA